MAATSDSYLYIDSGTIGVPRPLRGLLPSSEQLSKTSSCYSCVLLVYTYVDQTAPTEAGGALFSVLSF